MKKDKDKETTQSFDGVKNWLIYGVFWSVAPLLAVIICRLAVGYDVIFPGFAPDAFLLVFAVSVNLLCSKIEFSEKHSDANGFWTKVVRFFSGVFARAGMFGFGVIYLILYTGFASEETILKLDSQDSNIGLFAKIAIIWMLVDAVLGVVLKIVENRINQKSLSKKKRKGVQK